MADRFTFFEKFGNALAKLPPEDEAAMLRAIYRYGCFGEEPELEGYLEPMFELIADDIDNSKDSRQRGSRGGRPPKKAKQSRAGSGKPGVSENENQGFTETETTGFDVPKQEVSDSGNQGFTETESQTKPNHTKPSQTKPEVEVAKRKRFAPPAPDEVAAYAAEIGLPESEAERFRDHYEANGWKVGGRTKMSDWRAALRNWKRNAARFGDIDGKGEERELDEYSLIR